MYRRSHRTVSAVVAVLLTAGWVIVSSSVAGCVIVSSSTHTPPAPEVDAWVPPAPDSGPLPDGSQLRDGGGLGREEATRGLLASIAERVALPTYRALAAETGALEAATAAYASSGSSADRTAAQEAWVRAIAVAQRAELLQLGPAGMQTSEVIGGLGLRDAIYAWPSFNRCRIDVVTQRGDYADLDVLAMQGLFTRGLGAIEYLLFYEGTDHGCEPGATIGVDDPAWTALGADGVREARADHAHALARLVRSAADSLRDAWEPSGGDFAGQLSRAGEGGGVYATTQVALNAIFAAMLYVDRQIKDQKLGAPAAVNDRCMTASCPEQLESRFAHRSSEHLAENLRAFEELFLGGPRETDALGFDDLLLAVGAAELEVAMRQAIAAAVDLSRALSPVDQATFESHQDEYVAMHAAVRRISDLLKTEFKTVLALELPMGTPEDND